MSSYWQTKLWAALDGSQKVYFKPSLFLSVSFFLPSHPPSLPSSSSPISAPRPIEQEVESSGSKWRKSQSFSVAIDFHAGFKVSRVTELPLPPPPPLPIPEIGAPVIYKLINPAGPQWLDSALPFRGGKCSPPQGRIGCHCGGRHGKGRPTAIPAPPPPSNCKL